MKEIPTVMRGYAIGQQDFSILREDGAIYVDKTEFVDRIIKSNSKYYFLARPRRFGKSLFLSTLRYFFEGRRELFKGLYIDSTDWNWEEYPVLRLDLNPERYDEPGRLNNVVGNLLCKWEREYGVTEVRDSLPERFYNVIEAAHEKTGQKVVILVDEYDKPLVSNLNKSDLFEHYRSKLAALYANFKSSAEHIRLVFLTGVARFSKLSLFSDLNNLDDITFNNEFADICGITETELLSYFKEGITKLASEYEVDYDDACRLLKKNYDGYKFAATGSEIYNPWSVLNAMQKSDIGNFWDETGSPTLIAEALKRINADLTTYFDARCYEHELKGLDLLNPNPIALLYQTGYLTIKSFKRASRVFQLGIPNDEVEFGLFNFLIPYYIKTKTDTPNRAVAGIIDGFISGDPQEAMKCLQAYFAGIDYKLKMDNENNFHNAFHLIMDLIGLKTDAEVHTSEGSIDLKIETEDFIYIIELKYDHTAEEALRQIEEKQYARPYHTDSRRIFLIGAAFSSKTRTIECWKISHSV